jgi:hypothetical protein
MRVTNCIPLGCSLLLPVGTVNYVETLKAIKGPDRVSIVPGDGRKSFKTKDRANKKTAPAAVSQLKSAVKEREMAHRMLAGGRAGSGGGGKRSKLVKSNSDPGTGSSCGSRADHDADGFESLDAWFSLHHGDHAETIDTSDISSVLTDGTVIRFC